MKAEQLSILKKSIKIGDYDLCKNIVNNGGIFQKRQWDGFLFLVKNLNLPYHYGNDENFNNQCVKYFNQLKIFELMLTKGIENKEDDFGTTPLEILISKGLIEFVELALSNGMKPNGNCFREACRQKDFETFKVLLKFEPNYISKVNRNYLHYEHPADMILSFYEDENQWHKYKDAIEVEESCDADPRTNALVNNLFHEKNLPKSARSKILKNLLDNFLFTQEEFYQFVIKLHPKEDREVLLQKAIEKENNFKLRIQEKIDVVSNDFNFFNIKNNKEAFNYVRNKYDDLLKDENYNVVKWVAIDSFENAISKKIPSYILSSIEDNKSIDEIASTLNTTERKLRNFIKKISQV